MPIKKNLFYALAVITVLVAAPVSAEEVASLPVNLPSSSIKPEPAKLISDTVMLENWLKNLRERKRDNAFAMLSQTSQERYGHTPKIFMNTLRLYHTALYEHVRFNLLTSAQAGSTHHLYKIELYDRHGTKSLALLRLAKNATDGTWQVEAMSVITSAKGRDT